MREKWIDNAKGIAMLMVIIGHVSGGLQGFFDFDFLYGVHLVVFFVLSGYTLKNRDVTKEYVNDKFIRLMVPYFITCLSVLIADIVNSGIQDHDLSLNTITSLISRDLLRTFFASGSITKFGSIELGTRIGAIWFLPALFFAYLFFQIIFKICKERLDTTGVVLAIIAIFGYISARFIWLPFSLQSAMVSTFFLYLGYSIKERRLLEKIKWYHYIIAISIFGLGVYLGYSYMGFVRADCIDLFVSVIVGLAGCLLVYGISKAYNGKLLQYIGKRTLIILCVHLFALETMGYYITIIKDSIGVSGNPRIWTNIVIHILFAVVGGIIIEKTKELTNHPKKILFDKLLKSENNREVSIDIAKGILIILMIIGHFQIDYTLRTIIFSCHMIAFVFLSGYCYNAARGIKQSLTRMTKAFLLPYVLVMFGDLLLNMNQWNYDYLRTTIVQYLLGFSFAKKVCPWCPSVGPVYFILLLFVVRLIYILLDKLIKKNTAKVLIITGISLFGTYLGKDGYWLPWSIDVACYCLFFYMLGHLFRDKGWLQSIKDNHIAYFVLSPIWVYMIYLGGMEIATRQYGKFGFAIIGSVAGVLLIIKLAKYIADHLPILRIFLQKTGQATIIILMVHTLLRPIIEKNASTLTGEGITFLLICLTAQIALGLGIKWLLTNLSRMAIAIKQTK